MRLDIRLLLPFVASPIVTAYVIFMGFILGYDFYEIRPFVANSAIISFCLGCFASLVTFVEKISLGSIKLWGRSNDQ